MRNANVETAECHSFPHPRPETRVGSAARKTRDRSAHAEFSATGRSSARSSAIATMSDLGACSLFPDTLPLRLVVRNVDGERGVAMARLGARAFVLRALHRDRVGPARDNRSVA